MMFCYFQAVAKWLISSNITCPEKLSINGGSNGGLLVGACINQVRTSNNIFFYILYITLIVLILFFLFIIQVPELFGAAVADVGVMDMLRYHKFTIGYAWKSDYGDPDKKEDFEYIFKYIIFFNLSKLSDFKL